jgi:hypothetical protein
MMAGLLSGFAGTLWGNRQRIGAAYFPTQKGVMQDDSSSDQLQERWQEAERNLNFWLERLDKAQTSAEREAMSAEATKWNDIAAERFDAMQRATQQAA